MGDGTELVAAVGRGDEQDVRRFLEAGADPDTLTEDGLPVLCRAIAAHDAGVADHRVRAVWRWEWERERP
ncbi:hypothetical protein C1708_06675 [Streptomyces sp. DH-12]|uniref:ankyrin repeat domain-containing protein n=1 Tax=unclassified Streptomyces TaxID=2593676 RepID=UPI000CCE558E|nr:ankyrin repeat domain-containing protein [Streptomyces sp. DH-12]PNV32015.1 hypothetical protein C1708_06675 [Streptomyces sp. DH-12]